jgi:DNA-directed RNA polymerase specialized sigma subunit
MPLSPDEARALVLANLGLAGQLAAAWCGRLPGYEFDDLYQENVIAMLIAARGWQPSRLTFASWAWLCMERRLGRIRAQGDLVKVPLYLARLVETARRAIAAGVPEAEALAALPTTPARRRLVSFALQARQGVALDPVGGRE